LKAARKLSVLGGDARKRRVWGFLTRQRPILPELTMFSSVVPAETLGSGCRGLWWSELEVRESGAVRKWKLVVASGMECGCERELRAKEELEKSKLIWELDFKKRKKEREESVGRLLKKF